jgi:hypothetical protein
MKDEELKAIELLVDVTNKHSLFAIDTFNAYVHNRLVSPTAKDLKITWDNIQLFIEKIWENAK